MLPFAMLPSLSECSRFTDWYRLHNVGPSAYDVLWWMGGGGTDHWLTGCCCCCCCCC